MARGEDVIEDQVPILQTSIHGEADINSCKAILVFARLPANFERLYISSLIG